MGVCMSMNFIISPTDITGNKIIFLSLSALLRHPCWVVNNAATFVCVGIAAEEAGADSS